MTLAPLDCPRQSHGLASFLDASNHSSLSKIFLKPFSSLLQVLFTRHQSDEKCSTLRCVVSELEKQYGKVQLAQDELVALRKHFDLMDLNYIRAGFSAELVSQHIALFQQAKKTQKPAVLVKEHAHQCSDRTDQIFTSDVRRERTTCDLEHQSAAFEVHAYFPCSVTESSLRKAFEIALIPVIGLSIFNGNGTLLRGSLVVALTNWNKTDTLCAGFEVNPTKTSRTSSDFTRADEVAAPEGIVGRLQNPFEAMISCSSPKSCSMAVDSPSCDLVRILFDDQHNVVSGKALISSYLIERKDLEIGEHVGGGSSGEVYKGFYKGEKVAVKKLRGMAKGSRTEGEFRREVLGLMSCAHKNVLKLYGVCLDSEHGICIVTKFMEGGSLLQYLQQKQGLKMKEVLRLAKDVAKGMEFLHSRGVVHMDLKTANVFLDKERNAVIGDLGVARFGMEKVKRGETIGTYRWMAPEVCGAESGDTGSFSSKSDVYSFGILLWELVTCQTPYADYNPVQAAVGVVMHGLRPAIPSSCFPPLRYLIEKCWDQNPSVRPPFSEIVQMLRIIAKQDWN